MTHTTIMILPWSHWDVQSLPFLWKRGAVFMVKEGPSHPCGRGQTTWILTEKIGKFTVIFIQTFAFCRLFVTFFKAFFWLSRQIWSIVCKSSFFIQNIDMKGNCLFWDYIWIAFLHSNLEKPSGWFSCHCAELGSTCILHVNSQS